MKPMKRLAKLHKRSEKAISMFLTTEQKLQQQNTEIENLVEELETQMSEISTLWNQAKVKKAENTKIIERIGEIVRS